MPCLHCGEIINICPYCKYTQSEEFLVCPKCGEVVDFCEYCGCSLNTSVLDDKAFDDAFRKLFNGSIDQKTCPKCLQEIGDTPFCPFCGCGITMSEQANYDSEFQNEFLPESVADILTVQVKSILKEIVKTRIQKEPKQRDDFNKLDNKSSGWTPYIYILLLIIAIAVIYNFLFGI